MEVHRLPDQPFANFDTIEEAIQRQGAELWGDVRNRTPGLFDRQYWHGMLMDLVLRDASFKKDLFQFVDVLPSLKSDQRIADYIRSYLVRPGRDLPGLLNLSVKMLSNRLTAPLAAKGLQANIVSLAENFIVGSDVEHALPVLRDLHERSIGFTADILGEKTNSDSEAEAYCRRYLDLIDHLSEAIKEWPERERLNTDHLGAIPLVNVSVKVSALDSQMDPVDPAGSVARLAKRVLPILLAAKDKGAFVNFDMEQWEYHFITYHLLEELLAHPQLKGWPHIGIVVQAYLKDAGRDIDFLASLARKRGAPITVRLVKGAYWDYEVIRARQNNIAPPVWLKKRETDANYERLAHRLLSRHEHLKPAFGSHNLRSLLAAVNIAEDLRLPPQALEIQMLVGMAEPIREAFLARGHRLRLYAPIGELLPGIAYLIRRLLENTSNSGFLSQGFLHVRDITELLASPHQVSGPEPSAAVPADKAGAFRNAPLLEFADPETGKRLQQAIDRLQAELPIEVPVAINGQEKKGLATRRRTSPNDNDLIVSITAQAGIAEAEAAVAAAHQAWPAWRDRSVDDRAALLERLAELLEEERYRLAAVQCIESGKPWQEADADVAEAIDFCRYYAQRARVELAPHRIGEAPGEINTLFHTGRGVAAIIAPWNFPLAILCGMTTAALVAGNTVIIKPSNNATVSGYCFYRKLIEAGVPAAVAQFLPSPGDTVGNHLVEHPHIAQLAFTGSREVGLAIIAKAGQTREGQEQVKRVVCEMGGKNANIVDADADLDQAVPLVVKGAFGYAGQKCSATSRVIVLEEIYETFVERLKAAIASLIIALADRPECRLGPVIDRQAKERLDAIIADVELSDRLIYKGDVGALTETGLFVPPVLVEVTDPTHPLFQQELFGPILTLIRARDFDHALELANQSSFALTGALFSRHREHIARAATEFRVGNLYINRQSTGAVVGRQPFGGFKMSGLGNKAGGPGYLTLFADAVCVTENTMRKGFSPDLTI